MYSTDNQNGNPYDALVGKWAPLLDHESLEPIQEYHKKKCTAVLLENQQNAMAQQAINEAAPVSSMGGNFGNAQVGDAGGLAGYDPILISLVRRAMPNLMAYDICGVQPMTAPTGLIFALKAKYQSQGGPEALFQEANPFAGATTSFDNPISGASASPFSSAGERQASAWDATRPGDTMGDWRGMTTTLGEGGVASDTFKQMAFDIERVAVEAKTRALKAEYSTELAQDLKAVHGLDAETELANILSTEILSEINREIVRTVYHNAKLGAAQADIYNRDLGVYDLFADSDGRWSAERFRGLMFQIEREANQIAKETRRGKGNIVICSSDVASALAMGGFLNISPALNVNLEVDDTGNTFVGTLNGKFKVYVDPYAAGTNTGNKFGDYVVVGYKGANPYDSGLFYCPYVPLQMVRAVSTDTFQPKIGFKTRYGIVANPFASNTNIDSVGGNQYYRIFAVKNLHGMGGSTFDGV